MKEKFEIKVNDPERKWFRKNFDETILDNKTIKERSEIETIRDLDKSIEQLICDVHEETHRSFENEDKSKPQNIVTTDELIRNLSFAQKRMVSMLGKVALSNEKLSNRVLWLTFVTVLLAFIQVIIAICKN